MPLQAGSRLGPYELSAPIGAGGMGEVWRGKDTRLDRSVAIKILPAGFAAGRGAPPALRARGEDDLLAQPPAHLHAVRRRARGRRALPRDGAARGRVARGSAAEGPAAARPGAEVRGAGRRGPRRRAQAGHRPPRPQARQRDADEDRGEAPRLRPRPPRRGTRRRLGLDGAADGGQAAHHRGDGARHVPVHGARAARGRGSRPADRHLRARRAALRDGDGAARVRGQVEDEPDRGDPLDRSRRRSRRSSR